MNSKLRDTLSDTIRLKLSIPLTTETLLQGKVTDNLYKIEAEAEKAIRKAVAEDMLGFTKDLESWIEYNKHDMGEMGLFIRTMYAKNGIAELRQKIKEWSEADTQEQSNIKESE